MSEELVLTRDGGVAILTINRADKMNAMTSEMWTELREVVQQIQEDDAAQVLVITGTGRAFCAGTDVEKRLAGVIAGTVSERSRSEVLEPIGYLASIIYGMTKPIIGAINGAAAGAGLSIALLCDIRIASEKARFGAAWVKIGLVPDLGASYLLPRAVGMAKALELMLTGEIIDAREAEQIGLVSKVVAHDDVLPASLDVAHRIAQGPPITVQWIKKISYRGLANNFDEQLYLETVAQSSCRGTSDHREGVAAFREKRPPVFRGA